MAVTVVAIAVSAVVMAVTVVVAAVMVVPCGCLHYHHGLAVIVDGLRIAVLRLWCLPHNRLLVVGCRRIGRAHIGLLHRVTALMGITLIGNAGADQTASTCAHYGTVAAPDVLADGSTGHCTYASTQHRVQVVCMGLGRHTDQATGQEQQGCQFADAASRRLKKAGRNRQNRCCLHGLVLGLSPYR